MKRPALPLPASLRALQPPEVLRALDGARAPARHRRATATPLVTSARVEASGAIVARVDGLRLVNVANAREHWATRKRRVSREHAAINAALRGVRLPAGPRWAVTITREGRGLLDDDGLAISAKGVRDAVAAALGVDDGPRGPVTWRYAQRRAKTSAVEVRVEVCDEE